jgi:hypothetical protein
MDVHYELKVSKIYRGHHLAYHQTKVLPRHVHPKDYVYQKSHANAVQQ